MISFTFDDGYTSTYTQAAPILREFGMVGTVGAICNYFLWKPSPDIMRLDKLHQLAGAGWEIASHSLFHRRLPHLPPSYADEVAEWHYDSEAEAFVADCPWEDIGTVVRDGKYLPRAESMQELRAMAAGFVHDRQSAKVYARTGGASREDVQLRFGSAEREIAESRPALEAAGFKVQSFIVPFSMWPDRLHPIGARYYPIVATVRGWRLNDREKTLPTQLSRIQINKNRSSNDVIQILKHHLFSDSWAIICFHAIVENTVGMWDWSVPEFRRLVEWVAASNTPVVTLSSGATNLTNWGPLPELERPQAGLFATGAA